MWRLFEFIAARFGDAQILVSLYSAAFALGFGLGLRPCEYLQASLSSSVSDPLEVVDELSEVVDTHILCGAKCFWKWLGDERFFPCTDPSSFPEGVPELFVGILDSAKNDQHGKGAPRTLAAAPPGSKFDCVSTLFSFLKEYPPRPTAPLLSGVDGQPVTVKMVNCILKQFANFVGLDPARLLPHSIRVGSSSQTDGMALQDRLDHTGHASVGGARSYFRKSVDLARRSTSFIHDTSTHTLDAIRLQYS